MSEWPPETGRYQIGDKNSCVAVCTLSSLDIELPMDSIAISGKCVTENIGVEKIIKNIISNPNIRYLLICGVEPKGHYVGQAFFCLRDNGLDENKKIIGARGAMPFIKNLSKDASQVAIMNRTSPSYDDAVVWRHRNRRSSLPVCRLGIDREFIT